MGGRGVENLVAAEIHDDHTVVFDKAETVGPWRKPLIAKRDGHFGDQVGLVLLLDSGGVSRGIDYGKENQLAIGKSDASGIASLNRGALTAEEYGGGQNRRGLFPVQDAGG